MYPITLAIAIVACATGVQSAAILEAINFNLNPLHTGSTLSGTFTLSDAPAVGDTASVVLSFSDPSDYSPTSLTSTITIMSGTPSGLAVTFSPLTFTNLSGTVTPIDTKDVSLTAFAVRSVRIIPLHIERRIPGPQPGGVYVDVHDRPRAGSRAQRFPAATRVANGYGLQTATRSELTDGGSALKG